MRIDELVGVKRFAGMTSAQIVDFLRSNLGSNLTLLGNGSFGAAITNGKDVFKIWMQDSAYTDFVRYALNNQNNPFLPKFKSGVKKMPAFFLRHEEAPDFVYYVKMEKLEPFNAHRFGFVTEVPETANYDEDEGFNTYLGVKEVLNILERCDLDSPISVTNQFLSKLGDWRGCKYEITDIDDELKLFIKTVSEITALGHQTDFHEGNMMLRGMQLVLTDPVANREDMVIARKFDAFNEKLRKGSQVSNEPKLPARKT